MVGTQKRLFGQQWRPSTRGDPSAGPARRLRRKRECGGLGSPESPPGVCRTGPAGVVSQPGLLEWQGRAFDPPLQSVALVLAPYS